MLLPKTGCAARSELSTVAARYRALNVLETQGSTSGTGDSQALDAVACHRPGSGDVAAAGLAFVQFPQLPRARSRIANGLACLWAHRYPKLSRWRPHLSMDRTRDGSRARRPAAVLRRQRSASRCSRAAAGDRSMGDGSAVASKPARARRLHLPILIHEQVGILDRSRPVASPRHAKDRDIRGPALPGTVAATDELAIDVVVHDPKCPGRRRWQSIIRRIPPYRLVDR